jgi:hypothetical protein
LTTFIDHRQAIADCRFAIADCSALTRRQPTAAFHRAWWTVALTPRPMKPGRSRSNDKGHFTEKVLDAIHTQHLGERCCVVSRILTFLQSNHFFFPKRTTSVRRRSARHLLDI